MDVRGSWLFTTAYSSRALYLEMFSRVLCSQNLCEILVSEKGRDCLVPEKYLSLPTADNSTLASLNSV